MHPHDSGESSTFTSHSASVHARWLGCIPSWPSVYSIAFEPSCTRYMTTSTPMTAQYTAYMRILPARICFSCTLNATVATFPSSIPSRNMNAVWSSA